MTRATASCDACGWSGGPYRSTAQADYALSRHSCALHLARAERAAQAAAKAAAVDRTPRPCLHKHARHEHGTHTTYVLDQCRCRPCADANGRYERARSRAHAYGRYDRLTDAQPVRDHIRALQADGLGLKTVAACAGVSNATVTRIIYGRKGQPPSQRVSKDVAAKILSLTAGQAADAAVVDGTGTQRRLRALVAIGWSQTKLAARVGMTLHRLNQVVLADDPHITVATRRAVTALYDRLWDATPPAQDKASRVARTRARNYAAARGWAVPLAWDDSAIDDPQARPITGQAPQRAGRGRPAEDVAEDVEWLLEQDSLATAQQLADRLHIGVDGIQKACRRAGRRDLLDRLTRNARLTSPKGTAAA